jgi:hypothetical protein
METKEGVWTFATCAASSPLSKNYFATLAQMLFFVYLQAPFTSGGTGLQSVPCGTLFGLVDLASDMTRSYVTLAGG